MSHHKWLLVIALVCPVQMCSQGQPSAHVLFAGCYRVVSLAWQPPDEDIKLIPERFQLRSEPAFESSKEMFAVRSIPASGNLMEIGRARVGKEDRCRCTQSQRENKKHES